MQASLSFPPFELDAAEARLTRRGVIVALRPKTLAVLRELTSRPGHLFSHDELLDAVWPDTQVSDAAVKVAIRELRAVLGDDARTPRFIETVHRLGYRFIAPVTRVTAGVAAAGSAATVVGRTVELDVVSRCLADAVAGQRRVVFVTGEPGIGKTTLVDLLLSTASGEPPSLRIARGQCVEHYGTVEAFLPVLEGLTRLVSEADGGQLVPLLRRHAPSWLMQLAGVVTAEEREALRRDHASGSRERMLRELVVGLEALTADTPLVLVLEDLHWGDHSTLDLIAALARRREPARLLVLATYRPSDPVAGSDPVAAMAQELALRGHATAVPLGRLDAGAVADYVAARFPGLTPPGALAGTLHRHTDGNPLFMASAADHLVARGAISRTSDGWAFGARPAEIDLEVPASLREMIARQLHTASTEELDVLEAAAVAGLEFSDQALAAALRLALDPVRALCAELIARRWIRSNGGSEWPDGSRARRYSFAHALYRDAAAEGLEPTRRAGLHRRIAERLEAGFGERAAEVAAELAMHLERAGEPAQAVKYLELAAQGAVRRHAYREAILQLVRALELLEQTAGGDARELELRIALGVPLINTRGFAAPEVEQNYGRALTLCERIGATPRLFPVLEGLHSYCVMRRELATARTLALRMLEIAESERDPTELIEAHHAVGNVEFRRGALAAARAHLEMAIALYDRAGLANAYEMSGHDPRVCCQAMLAVALGLGGRPDDGLAQALEALEHARALAHPYSISIAQLQLAWVRYLRREPTAALEVAREAVAGARREGFTYSLAMALLFSGWALVHTGEVEAGFADLGEGEAVCTAIGAGVGRLEHLGLLADACAHVGRTAEGLAAVEEALAIVERSGERHSEAGLRRLRHELARPAPTTIPAARA